MNKKKKKIQLWRMKLPHQKNNKKPSLKSNNLKNNNLKKPILQKMQKMKEIINIKRKISKRLSSYIKKLLT